MFIVALFTTAKIWKQTKCPLMDEWINKMCVYVCVHTHIHTRILLSHKRNEVLTFAIIPPRGYSA